MMDGWGNNGWSSGGALVMIVVMVSLVAVAVWAVLRLSRRPEQPARDGLESARHLLDRRLAAGEIDEQQYAQTRRVLEGRGVEQTLHKGGS